MAPILAKHYPDWILDKLLASLADIRLACKSMPGTNAVAYFASASVTKKKVFDTFTPGPVV